MLIKSCSFFLILDPRKKWIYSYSMKKRIFPPINNQKGIAVLIAVALIAVAVSASLEMNRKSRTAFMSASVIRDRLTLSRMASSGVQVAMAMLIKDKKTTRVDSIQEDWNNPEKIAEAMESLEFEKGKVSISITDELGNIQVNALVDFPAGRNFVDSQKIMWDRILRLIKSKNDAFQDIEPTEIINSMKDWMDSGDDEATTGLNGAESDYYEDRDPPYFCANGPFHHPGEILLVKGMIPELFYGIGEIPGISEYITVHGMTRSQRRVNKRRFQFEGRVNINTCPLPVMIALVPSENPEYAQDIISYRDEKNAEGDYIHNLSAPLWYKHAVSEDITIDSRLFTLVSDIFRIRADAEINDRSLSIIAVVERERVKKTGKVKCKVLSWETL